MEHALSMGKTHLDSGLFSLKKVKTFFWTVAVFMGLLNAWVGRHDMNPDGISYLDIADAYLQQDWSSAISGCWSPLYPGLLALGLALLKPLPYWEFATAHLVNFFIYLGALAAFEFLLGELRQQYDSDQTAVPRHDENRRMMLPVWAWHALGYALFIRASLFFADLSTVNPDLCTAALIYWSCGLLVRIRRTAHAETKSLALLGLALGLAYLSRSFIFPLAFVFIGGVYFSTKKIGSALLTGFVFFAVISPFVWALSRTEGRPFAFMSGKKLEYLLLEGHFSGYETFKPEDQAKFRYFPKKLYDNPSVYSFDFPVRGTYPIHYNPSYWREGIKATWKLKAKMTETLSSLQLSAFLFLKRMEYLAVAILIFLGMSRQGWKSYARRLAERWDLLLPTFFCLAMFCVSHLENRYAGPFFALFWLAAFLGVRLPKSADFMKLAEQVMRAIVLMMMVQTFILNREPVYAVLHDYLRGKDGLSVHEQWVIADSLKREGLRPGDSLGIIGDGGASYWARLLRGRIMAEIPRSLTPQFWRAEASRQAGALQAFTSAGVKAVVMKKEPLDSPSPGCRRIAATDYYVFLPSAAGQT